MKKDWYKSRTIWLNGLSAVAVAVADNALILEAVVPPMYYPFIIIAVNVANMVLRADTSAPIRGK